MYNIFLNIHLIIISQECLIKSKIFCFDIFVAYDGPLQYAMFQTNTEVGPYAERKNSEGTINGKFIDRLFKNKVHLSIYY